MRDTLDTLLRREDLTETQAAAAMEQVMAGVATPAQIAGFLVALAMKGERPREIVGLARTMRAHAVTLPHPRESCFDTCGTGGDRSHTFNVSSLSAIVLAACGIEVAKHGNRSVSSRCGSADLFEALGVNVSAGPAVVERCLDEAGIAFLFAPTFHPSMRHAGPVRRELGIRTAFNVLGPLTNPRRSPAAGSRRAAARTGRSGRAGAGRARFRAGLGGARGGGARRDLGGGAHEGLRGARRYALHVLRAPFRLRPRSNHPRPAPCRRTGRQRPHRLGRCWAARRVPRGTSCSPTPAGLLVAGRAGSLADGVQMGLDALRSGRAATTLERMAQCSQAQEREA